MYSYRLTVSESLTKSRWALLVILTLLWIPRGICGQTLVTSRMDGHTPSALTAGSPVGSYPRSGFESVNPYNGALNFNFPLLRIGGRGSAGYTMMLPIETRWIVERHVWPPPNPTCGTQCSWRLEQWDPVDFHLAVMAPSAERYRPGKLETRSSGEGYTDCSPSDSTVYYVTTLTRFTFTAADGTQIEFRDAATGGQSRANPMGSQCQTGLGFNRGKVFFAGDGSAASFISDADVRDFTRAGDGPASPNGRLRFADGTTYKVEEGEIVWMRDRNGNKVTPTTDALGRQVTVTLTDLQTTLFDQISYKGFGGATRNIKVWYGPLNEILRVTQPGDSATIKTYYQLFPGLNFPPLSNPEFNPFLVRRLELPDGRNYRFFYNAYAELARIELPTGGAIEYDHDGGLSAGTSGVVNGSNPGIYRRVIERRTYSDATNLNSLETKTVFSRPQIRSVADYDDFVDVTEFNATAIVLSRIRHFYHSNAGLSFFSPHFPNEYTDWREGKEYKTEFYAANNSLLKRVENLWEQTPATGAENNPHITRTTTTLTDVIPNLVTKQEFTYDQFNNVVDEYEYEFGSGGPGALRRRTHTEYVTAAAYTDADTGAHLRRLPSEVSIFDASDVLRARSSFEYDDYSDAPPNHASLIPRGSISGFDPAFSSTYNPRGNVTAATSYIVTNGSVTGSITAYNQYDIAGNVVKSLDARGFVTEFEFFDHFGAPDGDARGHTPPAELGGASSYAFVTKAINALGHESYAQFDYYLGQPVDAEDLNGMIVSAYFNDVLDRPTRVRRAVGTSLVNDTTFAYDDGDARTITTTTDLDATTKLVSKTLYDGLGRTIETRTYEGGNNYIAVKQIPFTMQQDPDSGALVRSTQSSNPYRPPGEQPEWTTTFFDALGRIVKVRTPDTAIVRTSYSGNTVTVTDQAGKARKSVTDALGRLIEVYEDPEVPDGPAELNYQTVYTYDVLDNLVKVTQGSQQRFFMYDSLKRLICVRNPEQDTNVNLNLTDPLTGNTAWSIGYQYDANGNLTQKTDAREVVSTYVYDALNRNTTVDYSTTSISPDVSRFYDGAGNGKGRLWYSYAGGNESLGSNVEKTVVDSYDLLGRPLVLRQLFKLDGVWKSPYQVSRTYNLAGAVTSQTYPSGRSVTYNYDSAGRLADKDQQHPAFTGNLGGVALTYSRGITYAPGGQLKREQFGTDTAVYNKLLYNSRQQLAEILVSTSPGADSSDRGKIVTDYTLQCSGAACNATDNNGNVRKQAVHIPDDDEASTWTTWYQQYDYDALNRLQRVHEYTINPALDWQQEFDYDRWGNRTINTAGTWIGNQNNPPNPLLNETQFDGSLLASTNRLQAPGDQALPENERRMRYDNAGNLIHDTYTGSGERVYDAENRMIKAWGGDNQWQYYTYNADGQRTRRKINNQETWQVYGFDGELIAEYAANGAANSPQKEYGYRNGQLLVIAEPATAPAVNVALAAEGATATASSAFSGFAAAGAINGDRRGLFAWQDGYWSSAGPGFPAWLEVQFNGSKTIAEIDVVTTQDNYNAPIEPTESTSFSLGGLTSYEVQYWSGGAWVTVPGGSVSGNNKVWKKFSFAPVTTTKIRVLSSASPDNYSRLTEVEAWTGPSPAPRYNLALAAMGAVATASNSYNAGYGPGGANNGDRKSLNWTNGGGWNDSGPPFPDWLQIEFGSVKTINEVDVFTVQDNWSNSVEPTEAMTFTLWGLTGYEVQYWDGSAWITIPGASVTDNNKIWRKFVFSPISTSKIRVLTNSSVDGYSRITEVEAYGPADSGGAGGIQWLISDHLGTPRMVMDQSGRLEDMRRHDYLPFGEELFAGTGSRTVTLGYAGDGVRQQFTSKERDLETGLDYFLARYYSSTQGRFTSPDEFKGGPRELRVLGSGDSQQQALVYADVTNPQSLTKYQYCFNNPLRYIDPDGQNPQDSFQNRLDHLIRQQLKGEITEDEYWKALRGPFIATAGAIAIIIAARGGQAVLTPLAIWATSNPDKVQQIAQGLQEVAGGPPGLTLAANSRLRLAEISTGRRLANQLGLRLQESAHEGADYIVAGTKTAIDAIGSPDAYKNWARDNGAGFLKQLVRHVGQKSVDYIAVDLKGASKAQIEVIEKTVGSLSKEQQQKIIYVR